MFCKWVSYLACTWLQFKHLLLKLSPYSFRMILWQI